MSISIYRTHTHYTLPYKYSRPSQVTRSFMGSLCTSPIINSFLLNWCPGLYLCSTSNLQTFSSHFFSTNKHTDVNTDTCEHPVTYAASRVSFHSGTNVCTTLTKVSGGRKCMNPVTTSLSHLPTPTTGILQCSQVNPLYSLHPTTILRMNSPVLGYSSKRQMDLALGYQNLNV